MPTAAFTRIDQLLIRRCGEPLSLAELATYAGMPKSSLIRQFNDRHKLSPMRWLWLVRTVMAGELIAATPALPLRRVAGLCGFKSQAHFCRRFTATFHESPMRFRGHFIKLPPGPPLDARTALAQALRKVNRVTSSGRDGEK